MLLADIESKEFRMANRMICHMLGYDQEEITRLGVANIHPSEELPRVIEQFEKQVAGEITVARDIPMERKDGSVFYTDVNSTPVTLAGKEYLLGIFRDITERKRAEEALQESEERFRTVYEQSPIGIELFDSDGHLVGYNKAHSDTYGLPYPEKVKLPRLFDEMYMTDEIKERLIRGETVRLEGPIDLDKHRELGVYEAARTGTIYVQSVITPLHTGEEGSLSGYLVQVQDVTERYQMEAALRRQEEHFRSLIENSSEAIVILDGDGTISYQSPSYERAIGYRPENKIGTGMFDNIHPEDRAEVANTFAQLLGNPGAMSAVEARVQYQDGSWHTIEAFGKNLLYHPAVEGIVVNFRDITERKQADEALRESEERLRSTIESMNDLVFVLDRDGIFLDYAQPGRECDLYVPPEAFVGKSFREVLPPHVAEPLDATIDRVAANNAVQQFDYPMEIAGQERWYSAKVSMRRDRSGDFTGVTGVVREITERKQAQEALRLEKDNLNRILEAMRDGVYITNQEYDITYVNKALKKELGSPKGKKCYQYFNDADGVCPGCKNERVFTGSTARTEWYCSRNGITYDILNTPLENPDGSLSKLAILRDITRRKMADERLQEAYERERDVRGQLEAEIEKRTELTWALVHELKTPVTSLMASSEMLALELPEGPLHRLATNVNRSGSILSLRIGQLLDVARVEMGALELSLAQMDPLQFLQEVVDIMAPVSARGGQTLTADLPTCLPLITADDDRLRQVVQNLLGNALKFTPQGGTILLRAREKDSSLVVEVEDTGPGISPEDQERVFELYYRGRGTRDQPIGLGIGLALCKTLVEHHGGKIWLQSEKGKGSTFGFSIPLATEDQLKEEPEVDDQQ